MENKNRQMLLNFEASESPTTTQLPPNNNAEAPQNANVDFSLAERLAKQKKDSNQQIYKNVLSLVDHLY